MKLTHQYLYIFFILTLIALAPIIVLLIFKTGITYWYLLIIYLSLILLVLFNFRFIKLINNELSIHYPFIFKHQQIKFNTVKFRPSFEDNNSDYDFSPIFKLKIIDSKNKTIATLSDYEFKNIHDFYRLISKIKRVNTTETELYKKEKANQAKWILIEVPLLLLIGFFFIWIIYNNLKIQASFKIIGVIYFLIYIFLIIERAIINLKNYLNAEE